MEPRPAIRPEQSAQQFAPRNPVGPPSQLQQQPQIVRRPSITHNTGEIPIRAAPPLQRIDSRSTLPSQPQQQQFFNANQPSQQRIIQQRPIAPNQAAPQQFQPPRGDNPIKPIAQTFNRPQPPNIGQPLQQQGQILRPQPPLTQSSPIPGSQPIRLPPNQAQIQQRLPLNRPPIQQHPNQQIQGNGHSSQLQHQQGGPTTIRGAIPPTTQGPQFSTPHPNTDGQNIRLNLGQYRPLQSQVDQPRAQQPQQVHINKPPHLLQQQSIQAQNPIRRLSTQDRFRMTSEVNPVGEHQPSYIISNSDDVDDVIVRPINDTTILKSADTDNHQQQPKTQQPQYSQPPPLAQIHQQQDNRPPSIPAPKQLPPDNQNQKQQQQQQQQQQPRSVFQTNGSEPLTRTNGQPSQIKPPQPIAKPANNEQQKKQNGSNGKTDTNDDAPSGRAISSRASSHKSTEDVSSHRSSSRSRLLKSLEKPPEPPKKISMNKIQVGKAPPPNLRQVKSKIGSLDNATHKPGGGNIKIETKKLEFKGQPRIEAKNDKYAPKGGEKKIITTKLQWNAKSKIGSLENANHRPGGGDKKILTIKTDFKENAKPKVGSLVINANNNNNIETADNATAAATANE